MTAATQEEAIKFHPSKHRAIRERYHFIYTNRNSEEIKQNLLGSVSLRLLHVFNPFRLPIICLFDRIYILNMILFHHILLPYAGGLCKLINIYYSQYYFIYL